MEVKSLIKKVTRFALSAIYWLINATIVVLIIAYLTIGTNPTGLDEGALSLFVSFLLIALIPIGAIMSFVRLYLDRKRKVKDKLNSFISTLYILLSILLIMFVLRLYVN